MSPPSPLPVPSRRVALATLATLALPVGAGLGACAGSCAGSGEGGAGPSGPRPSSSARAPEAPPAPSTLALTLVVPAPRASWQSLRGSLGDALPLGVGGALSALFGVPLDAAVELDDAAPLALAVTLGEARAAPLDADDAGARATQPTGRAAPSTSFAWAARLRSSSGLVARLTAGASARFEVTAFEGGALLTPRDAARPPLGVIDEHLVLGSSPGAVTGLGVFVVRALARGAGATQGDATLRALPAGLAAVAAGLEGGEGPLGAFVAGASRELCEVLRALPAVALVLRSDRDGLSLEGELSLVGAAAPLRALFEGPAPSGEGPPALVASLPRDTALALATRQAPSARAERAIARARALGAELPVLGAAALEPLASALGGFARARGDVEALGLVLDGTGPTLFTASRADGEAAARARDALAAALEGPALGAALGAKGLGLDVGKTRVPRHERDVLRVRLSSERQASERQVSELPSALDLLLVTTDDRALATAGLSTRATLLALLDASPDEALGAGPEVRARLARVPASARLVLVADVPRLVAFRRGRPRPEAPGLVLLSLAEPSAAGAGARLRLELAPEALVALSDLVSWRP